MERDLSQILESRGINQVLWSGSKLSLRKGGVQVVIVALIWKSPGRHVEDMRACRGYLVKKISLW